MGPACASSDFATGDGGGRWASSYSAIIYAGTFERGSHVNSLLSPSHPAHRTKTGFLPDLATAVRYFHDLCDLVQDLAVNNYRQYRYRSCRATIRREALLEPGFGRGSGSAYPRRVADPLVVALGPILVRRTLSLTVTFFPDSAGRRGRSQSPSHHASAGSCRELGPEHRSSLSSGWTAGPPASRCLGPFYS